MAVINFKKLKEVSSKEILKKEFEKYGYEQKEMTQCKDNQ